MATRKTKPARHLPVFIPPMLATPGEPFSSDEFLFELKWDGMRATAYIEDDTYRIINRHENDITQRYPELEILQKLPGGTVLDGEMVAFDAEGHPRLHEIMIREQARSPVKIRMLSRSRPATFVCFDQLYDDYQSIMERPLIERRQRMQQTISPLIDTQLVASDGIVGDGQMFFEQVVARDLEGMVAKRLVSRYIPGLRSDSWIKIKKRQRLACLVLGYTPDGRDLDSLILAADLGDGLRYIGKVGSGLTHKMRDQLLDHCRQHPASQPFVSCPVKKAVWVQPGLYCLVRYLEMSTNGELRDPVFEELIEE